MAHTNGFVGMEVDLVHGALVAREAILDLPRVVIPHIHHSAILLLNIQGTMMPGQPITRSRPNVHAIGCPRNLSGSSTEKALRKDHVHLDEILLKVVLCPREDLLEPAARGEGADIPRPNYK